MPDSQVPATTKVTAVIVSYNRAADLRRCLAALEASTMRPQLEIMVVDAGSRDESATLDTEFPDVTIQRMPRNFGATKALNIGSRTAKGEYILFLDPGVELPPDAIERLAARLDSDQDAAAVCPLLADEAGTIVQHIRRLPRPDDISKAWRDESILLATPKVDGSAVPVEYPGRLALMVRQFYLRGVNYLDEKYGEFWADADLAFQIIRAGKRTLLLPDVRATLRPGPDFRSNAGIQAVLDADRASGAAVYAGKHFSFVASLGVRISAAMYALGQALTFRPGGWPLLMGILSGSKVNGTQSNY